MIVVSDLVKNINKNTVFMPKFLHQQDKIKEELNMPHPRLIKRTNHLLRVSIIAIALAGTVVTSSSLVADVLDMPNQDGKAMQERPLRGLTKAQVEHRFGSPVSRHGPTGDPAIYFWEYKGFTVYFENNYVLHTVSKTKSNTVMSK